MNTVSAHVRTLLAMLHPGEPSALPGFSGLFLGTMGLLIASRSLDALEIGDRVFAALGLVLATAGLSSLREARWTPKHLEGVPLPMGRQARPGVELTVYLAMITAAALALGLTWGWLGLSLRTVLDVPAPTGGAMVTAVLWGLGKAALLLLPLLVAASPRQAQRGPLALLRLLIPWLPVGVSAAAGWLDGPSGVLMTAGAMAAATTALLLLRHTGWERWRPTLPELGDPSQRARRGREPVTRLVADLRGGLLQGLGWGLALSVMAWLSLAGVALGWLPRDLEIAGILLIAGAFLVATQSSLRIPFTARFPAWRPPQLPWAGLPLPHGAFQRSIHAHQSLAWLALVPVQAAGLLLAYRLLPAEHIAIGGAEITLGLLLVMMPILMLWEGRQANTNRPGGVALRVAVVLLGLATVQVALFMTVNTMGFALDAESAVAQNWSRAAARLLGALGPSTALGLAWLAAGRLLILRDAEAQRCDARPTT